MATTLLGLVVWGSLLWLVGQLGGVVAAGTWLPVGIADMTAVVVGLPQHLGDPAQAWPAVYQAALPGPVFFYSVLGLLLLGIISAVSWGVRLLQGHGWPRRERKPATWARPSDYPELVVKAQASRRLALGYSTGPRPRLLAAESRHSVLVWGPPQMYKTAAIVIPALLEWDGPAMATSVKPDVLHTTIGHRRKRGEVWIYDPTGTSGLASHTWSPLASCTDWQAARQMGQWLTAAGAAAKMRDAVSDFFDVLGSKLLGPLLFAAAHDGRTMADVARWINTQEEKEPGKILEAIGDPRAMEAFGRTASVRNA